MPRQTYFLDSNALIALVVTDHVHHQVMRDWLMRVVTNPFHPVDQPGRPKPVPRYVIESISVCTTPTVEGALIRFLLHQKVSTQTALGALAALHDEEWHTFVPDTLSYTEIRPGGIIGYRQVTDAYIAEIARRSTGKLVTLDAGLRQLHSDIATDPFRDDT